MDPNTSGYALQEILDTECSAQNDGKAQQHSDAKVALHQLQYAVPWLDPLKHGRGTQSDSSEYR
jgi:hypothetical protein